VRVVFHCAVRTHDGLPAHLNEVTTNANLIRQYCFAMLAGNRNQMECRFYCPSTHARPTFRGHFLT
jgi:hypothetical protein